MANSISVFQPYRRFRKLVVPKERRVAVAADLSKEIRGNDATTCCNHIVVDDMNISDRSVAFCIIQAARLRHHDCLHLALLLAECSLTQRARVHGKSWYGI
jgi:hypothetical protein